MGFESLPGLWYAVTHPSVPLAMSVLALVIGLGLAFLPVRLGRPPRLQGCSGGLRQEPDGRARRHPPPGHYEPGAPIGR